MPTVTVRPGEPDEYVIPFTFGWEQRQIVGRMRRLKIDVDRAEAKAANLNPKTDQIELTGVDTVLLTDVKTGGSTWTLVCYSAEWLANRAGYTPGGDLREGTDQDLINGLIGEVSGWTAGTVNNFTGPLSFVFSHAQRHEALRRIEPNVPGEIQFRDFGTVDYIDRLGSDKTGSVELSASAGTIEDSITITERNRELSGTHIRVLGAHEGEAQLYANLVPADDTDAQNNLENVVTYSTPRWTEEADTDWDRWSNNDITDQATLEEEAANLGAELTDVHVTAETVVPTSVGLEIGDTVQVVKPDADLDRSMRVHKKWRRAGGRNDTDSDAAVVDKVELSTRTTLQEESDRDLEELRKFNTGFQGSAVWGSISPGRGPVNDGVPYEIPFYYPEVEYEHQVELLLRGLAYRAYSSGAAASGGTTNTSGATNTGEFLNYGEQNYDVGVEVDTGSNFVFVDVEVPNAPTGTFEGANITWSIFNKTGGDETYDYTLSNEDGAEPFESLSQTVNDDELVTQNYNVTSGISPGDTIRFGLSNGTIGTESASGTEGYFGLYVNSATSHDHQVTLPTHQHDPDPGVIEFQEFPQNVAVFANGTFVTDAVDTAPGRIYDNGLEPYAEMENQTVGTSSVVAFDKSNDYLFADTQTSAGDAQADGIWYWPTEVDFSTVDNILFPDPAESGQRNEIRFNTDSFDNSWAAVTAPSSPETRYSNIPTDRVIFVRETGINNTTNFPLTQSVDISGSGYLQLHAVGEDGDNTEWDLSEVILDRSGSGTDFEETVDLTAELNQGAWNTVTVESETLGHLDGTISILSYRQIGKRP